MESQDAAFDAQPLNPRRLRRAATHLDTIETPALNDVATSRLLVEEFDAGVHIISSDTTLPDTPSDKRLGATSTFRLLVVEQLFTL